jgi:hypothetical protein
MLFSWFDIKWYDSYEGVALLKTSSTGATAKHVPVSEEQAKADMSPTPITHVDGDQCYRFVRIGEELDDIETRGSGFWDVGVRRVSSFDSKTSRQIFPFQAQDSTMKMTLVVDTEDIQGMEAAHKMITTCAVSMIHV